MKIHKTDDYIIINEDGEFTILDRYNQNLARRRTGEVHFSPENPMKKILIVEDERIIAMDIQLTLESLGYEVIGISDNGKDAIETAENHHPDLIFMDIKINGKLDGIDTAKKILQQDNPVIIFCTSFSDENTKKRANVIDYSAYIKKPFSNYQIKQLLKEISGRRQLKKQA